MICLIIVEYRNRVVQTSIVVQSFHKCALASTKIIKPGGCLVKVPGQEEQVRTVQTVEHHGDDRSNAHTKERAGARRGCFPARIILFRHVHVEAAYSESHSIQFVMRLLK